VDDGGTVLLAPAVGRFDALTARGARASRRRLVPADAGAVWHDGDRSLVWGLPDSPVAGAPTLTRVVYAESAVRIDLVLLPELHLLLVDDASRTLVRLGRADVTYAGPDRDELDRLWPRAGFHRLERRGVLVEDVVTADIDELERRFPGAVAVGHQVVASTATARVMWVLIALSLGIAVGAWLLGR
jgi:hypothetical protein